MCGYAMAAVSIYNAIQQSQAIQEKGAYDNAVAQYNARVQENQATQVANKAVEAENIQRQKTAELISRQRAQLGAAGVDIGSGSASNLIADTAMMGAADAYRIKSNYADQVTALNEQASLTRAQGAAAQSMANTSAFNTLVGGVASGIASSGIADKWFTASSAANAPQYSLAASPTSSAFGFKSTGSLSGLKLATG